MSMGTITLKAHNTKTLPDEEHGYLSFEEFITFPTCKEVHEMLIYHPLLLEFEHQNIFLYVFKF